MHADVGTAMIQDCRFEKGTLDSTVVAWQLGREPRAPWRVVKRCALEYPQVIASPPILDDGTPFPTMLWLTCPALVAAVSDLESAGVIAQWRERVAGDEELASRLMRAEDEFKQVRHEEWLATGAIQGHGTSQERLQAVEKTGIGGQKDPLAVKCLHVHVALASAGIDDPIGEEILEKVGTFCEESLSRSGDTS